MKNKRDISVATSVKKFYSALINSYIANDEIYKIRLLDLALNFREHDDAASLDELSGKFGQDMPDDSEVDGLILGGYGALLKKACEGMDIIFN